MTSPLPGEHYCEKHQGNTAHYAKENCTVCQQAREIERLNTLIEELQLVQATIPEIVIEERDEARAKVWQLREELNALQTHFDIVTKAGAGKDAEIERLRGERDNWRDLYLETKATAEKLRDSREEGWRIAKVWQDRAEAKDAEIELLRCEIASEALCAEEDHRDLAEKETEIEQLRGLLREHLLGPTEAMTWRQAHEWHEDYLKRVREALGDKA